MSHTDMEKGGHLVIRGEKKSWYRFIYITIILILAPVILTSCGGGGKDKEAILTSIPTVKELKVPVNLKQASNVGSLHMEIVYDSAVLSATDVEPGELGTNAMIEFSLSTQGRVKVGVVDASGINGDGAVIALSFNVIDKNKTSQLTLENVECYNAKTLYDIVVSASPGNLSAKDGSYTAPEIILVN